MIEYIDMHKYIDVHNFLRTIFRHNQTEMSNKVALVKFISGILPNQCVGHSRKKGILS